MTFLCVELLKIRVHVIEVQTVEVGVFSRFPKLSNVGVKFKGRNAEDAGNNSLAVQKTEVQVKMIFDD